MKFKVLIDVVFIGVYNDCIYNLLSYLHLNGKMCDYVQYNEKEIARENFRLDELGQGSYVFFSLGMSVLTLENYVVPDLYIDFTKQGDNVEILLYFDIEDLVGITTRDKLDGLKLWCDRVMLIYSFSTYSCCMDNGDVTDTNELYFDSEGRYGSLYK
ncbi:hypothetical protein LNQ81_06280 [Myroides sp. M-43]|uniref:hypothetical protein n=1 Tax=Myroides oncorhynchi TaxID=2893756 RepID=UPI001E29A72A|nr:hypothetical protein [Myroides oncorhynchi]MCC9042298.1 hypothetical protein [Myroides oncorhynchi]